MKNNNNLENSNLNVQFPEISMVELLESGAHFGHKTNRWNPKMSKYIWGQKNGIHVINLQKTIPLMKKAFKAVYDVAASGGRILFVSTKKQSSDLIAEIAKKCGQYYVNYRWLGGILTNWETVSKSIKNLEDIKITLEGDTSGYTKKELLQLTRKQEKLEKALGGIVEMAGIPDMLFVVDVNHEITAIKEAKKLNIPVVAICDTNVNPTLIDYPIPGNDDSLKSVSLYCNLIAKVVLQGIQEGLSAVGFDLEDVASNDKADSKSEQAKK